MKLSDAVEVIQLQEDVDMDAASRKATLAVLGPVSVSVPKKAKSAKATSAHGKGRRN